MIQFLTQPITLDLWILIYAGLSIIFTTVFLTWIVAQDGPGWIFKHFFGVLILMLVVPIIFPLALIYYFVKGRS